MIFSIFKKYDKDGYDKDGYDRNWYDRHGFNKKWIHKDTWTEYDKYYFNKDWWNKESQSRYYWWYDIDWYDNKWLDERWFNRSGWNEKTKSEFDENWFSKDLSKYKYWYDRFKKYVYDKIDDSTKYNYSHQLIRENFIRDDEYTNFRLFEHSTKKANLKYVEFWYDKDGYNRKWFNYFWWDREGYNEEWYDREWYTRSWYDNVDWWDWYNREWYDFEWFDREGYNKEWFDYFWFNKEWYNEYWFNKWWYDKDGYDYRGYNKDWYNREWIRNKYYDILYELNEYASRFRWEWKDWKIWFLNIINLSKDSVNIEFYDFLSWSKWEDFCYYLEWWLEYDIIEYFKEKYDNDLIEVKIESINYDNLKPVLKAEKLDKSWIPKEDFCTDTKTWNLNERILKVFFFDTETTWKDPKNDQIIQFWWIFWTFKEWSKEFLEEARINQLIRPTKEISKEASEKHWIYKKDLENYWLIDEYIYEFLSFIKKADFVVWHNVEFDKSILIAETKRLGIPFDFSKVKWIDTMKPTSSLLKIPAPERSNDKYKWPKLIELYKFLFWKWFDNAHDAMADITATKDCFIELMKHYDVIKL